MNIIEQTEALKDLPDQALIREMQMPTGMAPPIFITTELKRRQRIRDEFKRREAADQPTVAEEVVMAAGVPQQGIMQMAKSMAPKTNMGQNTGIASMMPKQPTMGMSSGGVVKMQPGGSVPFYGLERKVFKGQEYFTDGDTVYKQYESGQLDVVRDPDVVEGILEYSPSASTEVGSISSVLNVDKPVGSMSNTIDPTIDRSALDPVLGIRPEMIPQFPDQGNPLFSSDRDTQKAISEVAGTEDLTPTRDIYRPFLQNQPQVQELLLPTAQPTGRQSLDGRMVSTVGPTAAELENAQKVLEMNPGLTASDEELELLGAKLNFLKRDPEEDSALFPNFDSEALNQQREERDKLLDEKIKADIALQEFLKRDPEEDSDLFPVKSRRRNRDKNEVKEQVESNLSGRNDPPRSDRKADTTFIAGDPRIEGLIKDLDKQNKTTTVNNAAAVVQDDIGVETLAVASGAQGAQAAAQAQQGFSDKQWLDIAALGAMISSGNPKDLQAAAKTFIGLQEKARDRKSKEATAAADRASSERIATARVNATIAATEQRRASAKARNDLNALQSIQEYLQDRLAEVSNPLGGPKEGALNADAYNKIKSSLDRVVDDIAGMGGTSLEAYDANKLYQDDIDVGS